MRSRTAVAALNSTSPELLTLGAISLVVGVLGSLIHEGLGHAGAALLLGAHGVSVGSAVMQYQPGSVTALGQRLIALAGPLASAAQGLVGLGVLRRTSSGQTPPGAAWYFWWLLGHAGLFTAAGYLLALSFAPFGDVHELVQGLPAELLWRTLTTLLGALLAYRSMVHAARTLAPHLPPAPARRPVLARLTLVPYLLGGLASVLVTALGTHDLFLTLASAGAASFGSGVLLVWLNFVLPRLRRAPETGALLRLGRDPGWLVAGVAALIVWTLLGRSA